MDYSLLLSVRRMIPEAVDEEEENILVKSMRQTTTINADEEDSDSNSFPNDNILAYSNKNSSKSKERLSIMDNSGTPHDFNKILSSRTTAL